MNQILIYIHIPFCRKKCLYCDFNSYVIDPIPEAGYVKAVLRELQHRAELPEWQGREVRSVYFGGGTPSLLSHKSVAAIVAAIAERFSLAPNAEVTIEANPGTVTAEGLEQLRTAGITRLSLGAQSFQDRLLKLLGRIHGAEETIAAFESARSAGYENIGLDLIYAIPSQSHGELRADLDQVIALDPEHVSAYTLTIEEGTPFAACAAQGELQPVDEDTTIAMMLEVSQRLKEAGILQYEISNFAKPGCESKHNSGYWDCMDYLGLGAGAHSFIAGCKGELRTHGKRWANEAKPERYMQTAVNTGHAESNIEELTRSDLIFEFFFLGLRRNIGIGLGHFKHIFGESVDSLYADVVERLTSQGLLIRTDTNLRLSSQGLFVADSVIQEFANPKEAA